MIASIKRRATRQFIESGKSKFSGMDERLAWQRLATLNSATAPTDFSNLRSVGLHRLTGDRQGYWAVTINCPWRLVFRFENGDAHDVEIVDYH